MAAARPHFDFHRPDQHHNVNSAAHARPGPAGYVDNIHQAAAAASAMFEAESIQRADGAAHLRRASAVNNNGMLSPSIATPWDYSSAMNGNRVQHAGHPHAFAQPMPSRVHFHNVANPPHPQQHYPQGWPVEHVHAKTEASEARDLAGPMMYDNVHPHAANPPREGPQTSRTMHAPMAAPPPPTTSAFAFAPQDEGAYSAHPTGQLPLSPHSHDDYMLMVAHEKEQKSNSKRSPPTSPRHKTVDHHRGDGVRKRNSRIPIPEGHTIDTIDTLIDGETNENEKKNLKQQKRLLRNREAALASRQRKKKYTLELENREKEFARSIEQLRNDVGSFEDKARRHEQAHQTLFVQNSHLQRENEMLSDDKRITAQRHEEETSQLRKRIRLLEEQLENATTNASAMSVAPSSSGYTDFNAEMDALTVDEHGWEHFDFVNDIHDDHSDVFNFHPPPTVEQPTPMLHKKSSLSTVRALSLNEAETADDNPVSSNLLFFLLLCGAFVASNPISMQSSGLPQVPADVRAAAPAVLNSLLSEPTPLQSHSNEASQGSMAEPGPSSVPLSGGQTDDRVGHMHERLTTPHRPQQVESAFSLTESQYASIAKLDQLNLDRPSRTDDPETHQSDSETGPVRANLAETLASMQSEQARQNPAAVYTRSLLWDQIPADVVREFKEMVREHAGTERSKQARTRAHPNPALHPQQVQQHQEQQIQYPSEHGHDLDEPMAEGNDDFDIKMESFNDFLDGDDDFATT